MKSAKSTCILLLGILTLFFSALFPPWDIFTRTPGGVTELPYGYSFLFTTPQPEGSNILIKITFSRLFGDWLVLFAGFGLALWIESRLSPSPPRRPAPEPSEKD